MSEDPRFEAGDERTIAAARAGGQRRARRRRGLHAEDLGPLDNIGDAQRWLVLIAGAVGSRIITSAEGNAMTRCASEWLKAEDIRLRAEDLTELRDRPALGP